MAEIKDLEKQKLQEEIALLKIQTAGFDKDKGKKQRRLTWQIALVGIIPTVVSILVILWISIYERTAENESDLATNCIEYLKLYEEKKGANVRTYKIVLLKELSNGCFSEFKGELDLLLIEEKRIQDDKSKSKVVADSITEKVKGKIDANNIPLDITEELNKEKVEINDINNISKNTLGKFKSSDEVRIIEENDLKKATNDEKEVINTIESDTNLINELEKSQINIAKTTENLRLKMEAPIFQDQYWVKQGYYIDTKDEGGNLKIYLIKLDATDDACILYIYE